MPTAQMYTLPLEFTPLNAKRTGPFFAAQCRPTPPEVIDHAEDRPEILICF